MFLLDLEVDNDAFKELPSDGQVILTSGGRSNDVFSYLLTVNVIDSPFEHNLLELWMVDLADD